MHLALGKFETWGQRAKRIASYKPEAIKRNKPTLREVNQNEFMQIEPAKVLLAPHQAD